MTTVYLIQCLCPQRHCIMGVAYEAEAEEAPRAAELKRKVEELVASGVIDPWCGICKSRAWHYETRATIYHTLAEAKGPLLESQLQQRRTAEFIHRSRN
jgi:hypothetical protein